MMLNKEKTMSQINLDIIKQFKDAFKFEKEVDQTFIDTYLNEEILTEHPSINWLYVCYLEDLPVIGIEDNIIYGLDSEGFLIDVCKGLENIPYEILRLESEYGTEFVKDVFKKNKNFALDFHKYEQWREENNIVLDQDNSYH